MSYINLRHRRLIYDIVGHATETIRYKAELTEQGMEVFLALLGTGSQACGFILLEVRHCFEEGEAVLDACGVYVHGSHCGWVGARRVTARVTAPHIARSCAAHRAPHDARVCARRTARRAPRASQCAAPHAARLTACRAARRSALQGSRGEGRGAHR